MFALLTNDDGIYAPGLAALEEAVNDDFETLVVAPSTEQSGVGHGITFLSPLTAKEVFRGEKQRGWAVDGSPADAVKLGVSEICPQRPDLIISGMNGTPSAPEIFQIMFKKENSSPRTLLTKPNSSR